MRYKALSGTGAAYCGVGRIKSAIDVGVLDGKMTSIPCNDQDARTGPALVLPGTWVVGMPLVRLFPREVVILCAVKALISGEFLLSLAQGLIA